LINITVPELCWVLALYLAVFEMVTVIQ